MVVACAAALAEAAVAVGRRRESRAVVEVATLYRHAQPKGLSRLALGRLVRLLPRQKGLAVEHGHGAELCPAAELALAALLLLGDLVEGLDGPARRARELVQLGLGGNR